MNQQRMVWYLAVLVLLPPVAANAAVIIDAGDHEINAAPGQIIEVEIRSTLGEGANFMDFALQINNGVGSAPRITRMDLNDEAFAPFGSPLPGGPPLFDDSANASVNVSYGAGADPSPTALEVLGTVALNSSTANVPIPSTFVILAKVELDATGFPSGSSWPLDFEASFFGPLVISDAAFSGYTVSLLPGTVTIIPEPASDVMGLFAVAGLVAVVIRARRRRAA